MWKKRRNKKEENEMWKKRRKEERVNERKEKEKKGKEGEGDERRGRERRTENGEDDTRNAPPSPDTFPSTKLGNNMTPIKGRLGKNTTPTNRSPKKLNQDLQVDPRRRRSNFNTSSCTDFSYTPEKTESPKYGLQSNRTAIYKEAKAHGNSRIRFQFSINRH